MSTSATGLSLPLTIDEISAEWLTDALRIRFSGVSVEAFEVLDIMRGASTKLRLRMQYDRAGRAAGLPPTMILKGGFEAHSEMMKFLYAWETGFYRDVIPRVTLHAPRCFFADSDPLSYQAIVLMEDLSARGVKFCDALHPQSHAQLERRLTALAKLHAETWETPDLRPGGSWSWVQGKFGEQLRAEQSRLLEPKVWEHYVRSPRGAASSVRYLDSAWMRAALDRIAAKAESLPYCLVHGDTHLGNLYEEQDGTPGFFDFCPARAPWQLEVSYHVGLALDIRDWPTLEKPLVQHYLRELEQALAPRGVGVPSLDEALRDCAQFLPWAFFIFLTNETRFQTESVNTAYAARLSAAILQSEREGRGLNL